MSAQNRKAVALECRAKLGGKGSEILIVEGERDGRNGRDGHERSLQKKRKLRLAPQPVEGKA